MSQNVNETLMAVTNTATTLKGHTTAPVMLALSLICTKMKMGQLVRVNTGLLLTTTHVTVREHCFCSSIFSFVLQCNMRHYTQFRMP